MIRLENIVIEEEGNVIAKSISFTLEKGEWVYIQGGENEVKNLFQLLLGHMPTYGGRYDYKGQEMKNLTKAQWATLRKQEIIGVSYENPLMNHFDVEKNIQMQLRYAGVYPTKWRKYSQEIMVYMGIEEIKNRRVEELTPLERWKVKLAKALVGGPSLILLYQPFKPLKEEDRKVLVDLLKRVKGRGVGILLLEEADYRIKEADRRYGMQNKELVELE